LSQSDFLLDFLIPQKPVVIEGVGRGWPAMDRWTLGFFGSQYGTRNVRVRDMGRPRSPQVPMALGDYIRYLEDRRLRADLRLDSLYLTDWQFARECPALLEDFSVPVYFRDDWMGYVDGTVRPDYRWIIIAGAGTEGVLHTDVNSTCAWLVVITGR
jgi:hypothetical protein